MRRFYRFRDRLIGVLAQVAAGPHPEGSHVGLLVIEENQHQLRVVLAQPCGAFKQLGHRGRRLLFREGLEEFPGEFIGEVSFLDLISKGQEMFPDSFLPPLCPPLPGVPIIQGPEAPCKPPERTLRRQHGWDVEELIMDLQQVGVSKDRLPEISDALKT